MYDKISVILKIERSCTMRTVFKNLNISGQLTDIIAEDGIIKTVGRVNEAGTDLHGMKVYPGLIDIHTHGIGGMDTMDADFELMAALYAKNGTTTFYPTTMTVSHESIVKVLTAPLPAKGARIEGFHLEGPYINEKYKGAQNAKYVRKPDINEFAGFDNVKLLTLAPEIEGAIDYIKNTDTLICLGHTDADYDTAMAAAEAGAKCLTHTFNAMPPLHHRKPALIGAASDSDMYVQVICDGKHIHPSVIRILYKLFGPDRMVLISDSMRATGVPDGEYEFGGLTITVTNKTARTQDGALAGSTSTLFECVKCAIAFGIPEAEAFKMASETPARLMGINRGIIKPGCDCDLIVLDDKNEINTVIINGEVI